MYVQCIQVSAMPVVVTSVSANGAVQSQPSTWPTLDPAAFSMRSNNNSKHVFLKKTTALSSEG